MNINSIITAICSLLLLMIGADKFFGFMEPPCSLMAGIAPMIWKTLGVLQLAGGILIWVPRYRKYVAGFFVGFMLFFTAFHLIEGTSDIGGALFIAGLMGLLIWNPSFMRKKFW